MTPKKLKKLVTVMKLEENCLQTIPAVISQMRDTVGVVASHRRRSRYDEALVRFANEAPRHVDEFVELVGEALATVYTDEEVDHLIEMYDCPVGQSIAAKQGAVNRLCGLAGQKWAEQVGKGLEARVLRLLREE